MDKRPFNFTTFTPSCVLVSMSKFSLSADPYYGLPAVDSLEALW